MKATGMIRSIDDLGRIVIPKAIRRAQEWAEGDLIEMFFNENTVILRKYEAEKEEQNDNTM